MGREGGLWISGCWSVYADVLETGFVELFVDVLWLLHEGLFVSCHQRLRLIMPLLVLIDGWFLKFDFLVYLPIMVVVAGFEVPLHVRPWTAVLAYVGW